MKYITLEGLEDSFSLEEKEEGLSAILATELTGIKAQTLFDNLDSMKQIEYGLESVMAGLEAHGYDVPTDVLLLAEVATENALRSLGEVGVNLVTALENSNPHQNSEIALESLEAVVLKIRDVTSKAYNRVSIMAKELYLAINKSLTLLKKEIEGYQKALRELPDEAKSDTFNYRKISAIHFNGSVNAKDIVKGMENMSNAVKVINGSYYDQVMKQAMAIATAIERQRNVLKEMNKELSSEEKEVVFEKMNNSVKEVSLAMSKDIRPPSDITTTLLPGGRQINSLQRGEKLFSRSNVEVKNTADIPTYSSSDIGNVLDASLDIVDTLIKAKLDRQKIFDDYDEDGRLKENNDLKTLKSNIAAYKQSESFRLLSDLGLGTGTLLTAVGLLTLTSVITVGGTVLLTSVALRALGEIWITQVGKKHGVSSRAGLRDVTKKIEDVRVPILQINRHAYNTALRGLELSVRAMRQYSSTIKTNA